MKYFYALILLITVACARKADVSPKLGIQGKWYVTDSSVWVYDFEPPVYYVNTLGASSEHDMSITDSVMILDNGVTQNRYKYTVVDDTLTTTSSLNHVSRYYRFKGI